MDRLDKPFNPEEYYSSYPCRVILRPGYPARAQYKSTLLWKLYGKQLLKSVDKINTYADIGGCFGFGANSMAFNISQHQGFYPKTTVFEISDDFCIIGCQLFPYISFVKGEFSGWKGSPEIFDLISMFDVIEHIPNPSSFLTFAANHFRYALLDTPLETGGEWFGAKPPKEQGYENEDGHVNFFTKDAYLNLLDSSGLELIDGKVVWSLVPPLSREILNPEITIRRRKNYSRIKKFGIFLLDSGVIPSYFYRKIIGHGYHIGLFRSLQL